MVAKTSSDPRLILRFGDNADVSIVAKFIEEHWKQGHILSRDRELFEYMFLEKDDRLNFVIAFEPQSNEVIAILGYIPSDALHSRIFLSMWKARPDAHLRKYKAGLAVLRFMIDELKPKSVFSTGISADTRDVYRFLGYSCDAMNHHVVVNNEIDDFKIIKNPPRVSFYSQPSHSTLSSLVVINTDKDLRNAASKLDFAETLKDVEYLSHRYLNHPRFKYEVREVLLNDKTVGVLFFRRLFANDRSCIRIIDVIGAETCLKTAIRPLAQEMIINGDEYIDLLSWGLDSNQIKEAGFTNCREFADSVVPEYFSPFSQTTVERWLFTNLPQTEIIYKGDGDQDRPN
jgi:hypothetical protein